MTAPTYPAAGPPPAPSARIGRLRVRHLQLLDAIGGQQSLTVAAAGLGMSQPRATNMLREMEEAFGRTLLDRSPRGVRLNAAGRVALERLRIALGALDAAQEALRGRAERPLVRIGVLPMVGSDRLSRVVAGLDAEGGLPRLVLRIGTVGELLALLLAGEVDGVICGLDAGDAASPASARLRTVRLWEEHNLVVAARANPLTRKRRVTLEESLQHPWLLMPPRSANRQALERMFLRAGLAPPEPAIETGTPQMALAYVARGRLLAPVPQTAFDQAAGQVARVRLEGELQPTWINLVTLKDVPRLPFVEYLGERLKKAAAAAR